MIRMNGLKRVTFITLSMVFISLSIQSSPPVTTSKVHGGTTKSIYEDQFEGSLAEPTHDQQNFYDATVSDAMELYSISAKRLVIVQDKPGTKPWDHESELIINKKQRIYGRENQFVTETVSYGRLKIKSEYAKQYLCVKNDGVISLKQNADSSKNHRSRKRCLFNMNLTQLMHITLSVYIGKTTWYLTVKDDVISMTDNLRSNELERSFMWLPTMSGTSLAPSRLRSFDDKSRTVCDSSNKRITNQIKKIKELQNEVNKLNDEIEKMKLENLKKN
ncbi:uncharacterized protein LOC100213053 isoform X2 [Hydra vulgaris]|uniref:Uncharacterized protein LOC100213053 isoform X2 n=1 Tax=Hydra vulgaris TaxID=6087 RepID=A0ABM4BJ33_HYDVU